LIDNEKAVAQEMTKYPISRLFFIPEDDLKASLANGDLNGVVWKKKIIPADEIDQYHIIEHTFRHGQHNEIPPDNKELLVVPDYKTAYASFEAIVKNAPKKDELTHLVMIGKFKGRSLEISPESYPVNNCGVLLDDIALPAGSREQAIRCEHINPAKPFVTKQRLFARMEPVSKSLVFYDDKLQRVDPARASVSVSAMYFDGKRPLALHTVPHLAQTNARTGAQHSRSDVVAEFDKVQTKSVETQEVRTGRKPGS
jgi:hypothetical protein